jgi:hypothetical protein
MSKIILTTVNLFNISRKWAEATQNKKLLPRKLPFFINLCVLNDSSVGIATGYGLDDRGSGNRFPEGAGNFSLLHRVHTGSGAHSASYAMGTGGSFPGSKAAGA